MPLISDLEDYLNSESVDDGDILVLLDQGRIRNPDETGFTRKTLEVRVKLPDDRVKLWTMNRTTQKACRAQWGDNTADWVGRCVKLKKILQPVRGEMIYVIFGQPCDCPTRPTLDKAKA